MPDILIGHLYKIDSLTHEGNDIAVQVTFDATHPIFGGHFPEMPVVPGVCQTQMIGETLGYVYHKDFMLKTAGSIKFLALIDPTKTPTINLAITAVKTDDGSYTVTAQYKWEAQVFFKFKGIYSTAA